MGYYQKLRGSGAAGGAGTEAAPHVQTPAHHQDLAPRLTPRRL